MKNLFKNLMLVAVAAMAFTSCSQDVNELNKLEKKTTFEFVASFDGDTRSGFTGSSEDENGKVVYHSEWFGGETVMLVAGDQVKSATVDAEGKFTATFDGEISQIDIYTPMESFYKPYMDYNFYQVNPEVLAEQTPLANSVDPKAHVAKGYVLVDGEGNQIIPVTLAHEVAYGKMTVNTPAEFVIDHVEIALNGVFDGSTRNLSYTINADKVENNVFWFATEPIDVAEFTVTAYDAEGKAVTRTVDVAEAGKTMSFQYGRVGTFSVSGLEEVVAPSAPMFTSAGYNGNPGDKVVKLYSDTLGELWMNFYGSNPLLSDDNWINPGQYGKGNGMYFGGNYGQYKPVGYLEFLTATPNSFTLDVSVVDGKYKFVINADYTNMYDGVVLENATFIGEIPGLGMPDMRTLLAAPSNVTGSADGKTITLSWDPVEGADGYRVSLYSPYEEYFEEIVTTNEYVYEAQLYSKQYSFTIMSYASETNAQYRYSEDVYEYAYVTTGKDPNKFADVVANKIIWDSSISAFKMTGEVVSGTAWGHSGDYIRLYINESDRPGNNSIKVDTYTGCGSTSPQAGQFGARFSLYWGSVTLPSNFGSQSTVEVSYDEAVGYTIVLTHNNVTYGYKGMPDGWVAPAEGGESGGDEPENPGDGGSNELGSETNPYTFTSVASNNFFLNFEGAENGASLQLDRQNSDVNVMSNYGGPFALNYTAIIYAGSGNIYNVNGAIYQYAQFAPYSTLEVTKANGNWTCKLKMSVDQGATYTYYTFTGQIANQAY